MHLTVLSLPCNFRRAVIRLNANTIDNHPTSRLIHTLNWLDRIFPSEGFYDATPALLAASVICIAIRLKWIDTTPHLLEVSKDTGTTTSLCVYSCVLLLGWLSTATAVQQCSNRLKCGAIGAV